MLLAVVVRSALVLPSSPADGSLCAPARHYVRLALNAGTRVRWISRKSSTPSCEFRAVCKLFVSPLVPLIALLVSPLESFVPSSSRSPFVAPSGSPVCTLYARAPSVVCKLRYAVRLRPRASGMGRHPMFAPSELLRSLVPDAVVMPRLCSACPAVLLRWLGDAVGWML